MFYNFRKNKKAFTLVELIVVIAIIGILGAVVGVSVSTFVSNAKKRSCKSTAESIADAWEMWASLNDNTTWNTYVKEQFPNNYNKTDTNISMSAAGNKTLAQMKADATNYTTYTIRFVSSDGYYCDVTAKPIAGTTPTVGNATKGTAKLANVVS